MSNPCTIRVALADDHKLVREGISSMLRTVPTVQLVGEASDGIEAVEIVEKSKPDVLLLDLRIPRLHGLEVLRQVRERTQTKVLVLSMHSNEAYLVEALSSGAHGYVLKDCSFTELAHAIRTVATDGQYLCETLRQKAMTATLKRFLPGGKAPKLTKRELIVLELAADGKTSAEIAEKLFISRRTAEAHRANLMRKLGLKTQTDLVLYAVRNGVVCP